MKIPEIAPKKHMSDRVALKIKRFLNTCPKKREWDVVRARVFQCFLCFFICFVFFCHLLHTFSVIFIKFIGHRICQLVLPRYTARFMISVGASCIYIYMYIKISVYTT